MPTPTTNPEPIPGFDAVAESRKWRAATSRLLASMSRDERLAYLAEARVRYLADREGKGVAIPDQAMGEESCVVREEPPKPEPQ